MASTLGGQKRGPIVGINVTPMVDVVLVLLVIMMVSATYIVAQSLKVDLPKSAVSEESAPKSVTVTVTKEGKLLLDDAEVTEPELSARYREAHGRNVDVSLVVSADREVQHGSVVRVIELAKEAEITKVAIHIERAK